jgi:hypothetical protein
MKQAFLACGLATSLIFVIGACGDDDDKEPDGGAVDQGPEVSIIDSSVDTSEDGGVDTLEPDTLPPESNMGEGCATQSDCLSGSPVCITHPIYKSLKVCTMECTPDDSTTPLVDEDNCPNGFICATFPYSSGDYNFCLKT